MATHSPESLAKVDRIVRLKDGRVESVQEAGCSPSFTASS
jgi:ABC-type lipoprotein export system ATPase subunit